MNRLSNSELEQLCLGLVKETQAQGVLLILLHKGQRAEIVSVFSEEVPDLPEVMQVLADQLKAGDGHPLGRHGHTVDQS